MSTVFRFCIVLSALGLGTAARAEKAVLECIADTWVEPGGPASHGRDDELVLMKGGAVALEFRSALVAGWNIEKATLLLHVRQGRVPGVVRVVPLADPWDESRAAWAEVLRAAGHPFKTRHYGQGYAAIELDPAILRGHGLAIFSSGGPVHFDSREMRDYSPYLLVEGMPGK